MVTIKIIQQNSKPLDINIRTKSTVRQLIFNQKSMQTAKSLVKSQHQLNTELPTEHRQEDTTQLVIWYTSYTLDG
jgi:hypothetical protein